MSASAIVPKKTRDGAGDSLRTTDTTFDKIYKFYYSQKNIKLTANEEIIRDRWEKAYSMLLAMKTPRKVAQTISKLFDLSSRTGYSDVNNAMRLFGDPRPGLKEAKVAIATEWIIKGIKKAWDNEDLMAYERLVGRYAKLNGLEDDNNPLAEMLKEMKPTSIVFSANKSVLEQQANELVADVEDVDYHLVSDED